MLKKCNRLNSNSAFKATYANNNFVSDKLIVLYAGKLKVNESYPTRVGFVVSKKIHKRAVIRNKIKRRMRECVRNVLKTDKPQGISCFQSLIFVARHNIVSADFNDISDSTLILLDKIAINNI